MRPFSSIEDLPSPYVEELDSSYDTSSPYGGTSEEIAYDPEAMAGLEILTSFLTIEATIAMIVSGIALYVMYSYALGKIFQKADVSAWKAWVPIYNSLIIFKLGNQSPLWTISLFIPFVNLVGAVFTYIAMHKMNVKLGRGIGSTLLAIFLPVIWLAILAFGPDQWDERRVQA